MQLHNIERPKSLRRKKTVGRGGKRGTYSGRGLKGQKARSGGNVRPGFEGQDTTLVQRSPKLRGFNSPNLPNIEISLSFLEKHFRNNDTVNLRVLHEKKLVKNTKKGRAKRAAKVKILASGKVTKPLIIENLLISKGAKEAIEKAGGKVVMK